MRVVMLGAPGSGKGTQGEQLAAALGVPHVSSGEVLRGHGGPEVQAKMLAGELVDDALMETVMWTRLAEPDARGGLVFDGFPRDAEQATALDRHLMRTGERIAATVLLDAPRDELVGRLLARAEVQGRLDDNPATIARRLDVYETETAPLVTYYEGRGVLRRVDGSGDVAAVYARMMAALNHV